MYMLLGDVKLQLSKVYDIFMKMCFYDGNEMQEDSW